MKPKERYDGEPVLLGRGVQLAPGEAAAGADGAGVRVNADLLETAQVDAQPAVGHGRAGDPVPAAVNRQG